jgi:glutathione synthase/RimK-type ligase-like ATP-grasp enzyme
LNAAREVAVLVVTHGVDDHAPLVRTELDQLGVEVAWFDTDNYRHANDLTFAVDSGLPVVHLRIGGREYCGDVFTAILYRHVRLPVAPHIVDREARRMAESELRWTLEGTLLALEPALWVNHPHANRLARSKLLQLRLATRLGFAVPDTRVTADPQEICRQYQAWDGRMVAKLVGGQIVGTTVDSQYVVYTTLITEEDLQNDEALSACPAIYQRLVDKRHDLRVTVVGDEVFTCRINSRQHEVGRVDWRVAGYTALDLQPCDLDAAVANRCRALTRALGLEIAGIDLIVTPEGETVFLEINAAGQWAWVQEATGLPIAASIARRLVSGGDGAVITMCPS